MNCRLAIASAIGLGVLPQASFAQSASALGAPTISRYSISQPDWPLLQGPSRKSARRGSLFALAPFPVYALLESPGCKNPWWQVGPSAWLCPDDATIGSIETPAHPSAIASRLDDFLLYVAIGKNGALGYRRVEDVDVGSPSAEMQPGFMLGITESSANGEAYLTTHGFWIPARDVQVVKPTPFAGTAVESDLDMAWVFDKRTPIYTAPEKKALPPAFVERLTQVSINGQQQRPSGLWLKTEGGWLKATDLRVPELQTPPEEVSADERWIDVDTKTQTLVAYVGPKPVYATLVSTGKGKPGSEQATPTGSYRLWIKLKRSDMDNLDDANSEPYAVEAVPYVMFFERGYGIHGTYWHDRFGTPRSHGCVNVSLNDAHWLFDFTSPHLPGGWSAVFPTANERGTLVRVR